jgi:hypothetical protein
LQIFYTFTPDNLSFNHFLNLFIMALSSHTICRIYGQVFGTPPFETAAGATAFTNVKPFPVAPNAYLQTARMNIWPLPNGYLVGNTYVYSVLEITAEGLNQQSIKFATDQSATNVASSAS